MLPPSSSYLLSIGGNLLIPAQNPSQLHRLLTTFKWGVIRDKDRNSFTSKTKSQAFRILANPNVSGKGNSEREIIMVDPLEAKRLAAKQMQEIRAKAKLKRRRQIEAINGAWAMIGLTAGLVIEGHTGKSILEQLAGYLFAIFHFFVH